MRNSIRRCSREQLDRAVHALTEEVADDPVEATHTARKALKKQRSLLRLSRAAFPAEERRGEMAAFREAGRKLSGTRDADVMIESLDDMSERFGGTVPKQTFAVVRAFLEARRDEEHADATRSGSTAAVAVDLRAARRRVEDWHLSHDGWSAFGPGLGRSYRRGRDAFRLARAEPTPPNLHDWRKRVKDLWYHARMLRPLAEPTMGAQAKEAHRLSELLGDDHDLWVLREALSTSAARKMPADLDPLIDVIDHRRAQLQAEAFILGERVYAERPKAFQRRIHHYWRAWRAESRAAASAVGA